MSEHRAGGEALLRFDSVSLVFGTGQHRVQALDSVTLEAAPACITGLVGPDGAGKTSLMRAAAGLLQPHDGVVRLLGVDVTQSPRTVAETVGYMPQRFGLYEELSVAENLDLYGDLQGIARSEREARYRDLLQMTGLAPFLGRLAGRLSGGMKQKLGLACALVRAPRLLLLDEPTVGVDPVSRRELWAIIERLVREAGVGVLVSTAYLDEVERCDRVCVLDGGRLVEQGPPRSFVDAMVGRIYTIKVPETQMTALAERAGASDDVIDASLERGRVRVVSRTARAPRIDADAIGETALVLEPATPRFEDYFVATLGHASSGSTTLATRATPTARAAPETRDVVIEVADVWRRFGAFAAVRGVSFEVRRGEIFGLLGANGAGKSTTFRMLCGLLPASAGRLRVGGVDLRVSRADARARIGYVAQRFSLYATLTVRQNLRFFAAAYGLSRRRRAERVRWAMDEFELTDLADTTGEDLPFGYRQRLALAGALMHEPEILFLDEATSGVDPLARREFWHRINALAAAGVTVLVTTHFMEEAEYCHRLVIMEAGRVLAEGSPGAIRARAASAEHADPSMEDAFIALIESAPPAAAA